MADDDTRPGSPDRITDLAALDQQHAWPREWTGAAFTSEYQARLTVAELRELAEEIAALGRR